MSLLTPTLIDYFRSRRYLIEAAGSVAFAAAGLTLGACQTNDFTLRSVDLTPPESLAQEISESEMLDVGIAVFDPNVPDSYDAARQSLVNIEVRRAESYYMPFVLKTLMESTGHWGAVRVVPGDTGSVDLMVRGKVVRSQGERLVLAIQAQDARGVPWFDRLYEGLASKYAYSDVMPPDTDPFQHVYTRIADDLTAALRELPASQRLEIRRTAEMRFARDMLPAAYDDYVERSPAGAMEVVRLPAEDDPMMRSVRKVRQREFLFVDTLDAHYAEYWRRIQPPYDAWRKAAYSASMARMELAQKKRQNLWAGTLSMLIGIAGGPATLAGVSTGAEMLRENFTHEDEVQIHGAKLQELSADMEAHVMPYTLELENRSVELTGTVEEQFARLKEILRRSYYRDLGLAEGE